MWYQGIEQHSDDMFVKFGGRQAEREFVARMSSQLAWRIAQLIHRTYLLMATGDRSWREKRIAYDVTRCNLVLGGLMILQYSELGFFWRVLSKSALRRICDLVITTNTITYAQTIEFDRVRDSSLKQCSDVTLNSLRRPW